MDENKVGALPASGFSEAIAKILNHSGIPKPKRIKLEGHAHVKPELPLIDDTVESSSTTGNLHGTLKPLDIVVPHKGVKRTRKEIEEPWHTVPDISIDRERERKLTKIATRGVVQLFNAVRQQQNTLQEQLEEAGPSVRRSEKVLKSVSKGAFLDMMKDSTAAMRTSTLKDSASRSAHDSSPKRWEVLSDGYMLSTSHDEQEKEPSEISDRALDDAEEVF